MRPKSRNLQEYKKREWGGCTFDKKRKKTEKGPTLCALFFCMTASINTPAGFTLKHTLYLQCQIAALDELFGDARQVCFPKKFLTTCIRFINTMSTFHVTVLNSFQRCHCDWPPANVTAYHHDVFKLMSWHAGDLSSFAVSCSILHPIITLWDIIP